MKPGLREAITSIISGLVALIVILGLVPEGTVSVELQAAIATLIAFVLGNLNFVQFNKE